MMKQLMCLYMRVKTRKRKRFFLTKHTDTREKIYKKKKTRKLFFSKREKKRNNSSGDLSFFFLTHSIENYDSKKRRFVSLFDITGVNMLFVEIETKID